MAGRRQHGRNLRRVAKDNRLAGAESRETCPRSGLRDIRVARFSDRGWKKLLLLRKMQKRVSISVMRGHRGTETQSSVLYFRFSESLCLCGLYWAKAFPI